MEEEGLQPREGTPLRPRPQGWSRGGGVGGQHCGSWEGPSGEEGAMLLEDPGAPGLSSWPPGMFGKAPRDVMFQPLLGTWAFLASLPSPLA